MWKNSSWVCSRPWSDWMSSMRRMSVDAVAVLEGADAAVAQGVDELVGEGLHRDVGERQLRVVDRDEVPDGVQEVGLAEPHPAVDEEGVVGARRRLGHGEGGRLGEAVGGPGHEGLEGEPRLEAARGRRGGTETAGSGSGWAMAGPSAGAGFSLLGLLRPRAPRPADPRRSTSKRASRSSGRYRWWIHWRSSSVSTRQDEAIVRQGQGSCSREGELVGLAVERGAQPLAHLLPDGVALVGWGGEC